MAHYWHPVVGEFQSPIVDAEIVEIKNTFSSPLTVGCEVVSATELCEHHDVDTYVLYSCSYSTSP